MHHIRKNLLNIFCCFGLHDLDSNQPATLQTLPQRDSPASAALSPSAIPDIGATDDDLQRIFASTCTPGGYNAANTTHSRRFLPQGSLDLSFQFGSTGSPTRKQGSLEQLSIHLKDKILRHGIKKSNSKDHSVDLNHLSIPKVPEDDTKQFLSMSERSTGLIELLESRAVSQGGYDSDAQSLRTPILRSSAGTIRISPAFMRKSLKTILSEATDDDAAESILHETTSVRPALGREPRSSPSAHAPARQSFSSALQIGPEESPSDALRRISIGMANGTIQAPETPDAGAQGTQASGQRNEGWRLSLSAPKRLSSLGTHDQADQNILKRYRDRIDAAKRESCAPSARRQSSLLEDIDPALLGYLNRYGSPENHNSGRLEVTPLTAIKVPDNVASRPDASTSGLASNSEAHDRCKKEIVQPSDIHQQIASGSVHLLGMNISQRLASSSQTNSSASKSWDDSSSSLLMGEPALTLQTQVPWSLRYPKFIANEPNRRPSDPRTRKLFEDSTQLIRQTSKPEPSVQKPNPGVMAVDKTRKPVTKSAGSMNSSAFSMDGSTISPPLEKRRGSLKNQNSIAVGGRSASTGLPGLYPSGTRRSSGMHNLAASEIPFNGDYLPFDKRSVSLPWRQRMNQVQETPTPKARKDTSSIEQNERMSFEQFPPIPSKGSNLNTQSSDHDDADSGELFSEINCADIITKLREMSENDRVCQTDVIIQDEQTPKTKVPNPGNEVTDSAETSPSTASVVDELPGDVERNVNRIDRSRKQGDALLRRVSDESHQTRYLSIAHVRKRSCSTGDLGTLYHHDKGSRDVKHRKSSSLLSMRLLPIPARAQALLRSKRLKKLSLQKFGRNTVIPKESHATAGAGVFQLKNSVGALSGISLDEKHEKEDATWLGKFGHDRNSSFPEKSKIEEFSRNRMSRKKAKSMSFASFLEDKRNFGRKGLAKRLRRLYQASSPELKSPRTMHYHRSRLSLNDNMTDVKLDLVSEPHTPQITICGHDWASPEPHSTVNSCYDSISEIASDLEASGDAVHGINTADWSRMYAECVGSLTALQSKTSVGSSGQPRMRMLSLGSELRDSTIDFSATIEQEMNAAKAKLLRYGGDDSGREDGKKVDGGSVLSMPGGFE